MFIFQDNTIKYSRYCHQYRFCYVVMASCVSVKVDAPSRNEQVRDYAHFEQAILV